MKCLLTVLAPLVAFLKANAAIIFVRWMPFIFFAITVGIAFVFDSRVAFVGLCFVVISTITLMLDISGNLPAIKLPPTPPTKSS